MTETERIRVLLVITRLELGGAQRVVLHTARNLDRRIFDVALCWGPGDLLDDEAAAIRDLERIPVPTLVRPVAPISDLRALCLAPRRRSALFSRRWSTPTPPRREFSAVSRLDWRVCRRCTRSTVSVSRRCRRHRRDFSSRGREDDGAMDRPFRDGVGDRSPPRYRDGAFYARRSDGDPGRDRSRQRSRRPPTAMPFASDSGSRSVLLVTQIGNFKPQKAPLDFVRVAAAVHLTHPEAWFVMVGDGPLRELAERLARELGVADRMVFCGWWDDVPGLLAATTVSVLTSRHEGLPCSVVESLAAGVPVVATAVDGTVEVVRSGINGLLAPGRRYCGACPIDWRLLADPDLRERMAAAAREGLEEFDRDLMVRQQEDLYGWMCSHNRS